MDSFSQPGKDSDFERVVLYSREQNSQYLVSRFLDLVLSGSGSFPLVTMLFFEVLDANADFIYSVTLKM